MRPYYLCNHLQVFTFHEWGFPNSTSSCTTSCCSWMKFKLRTRANQHLQRVFYERPSCNRKQLVLVTGERGVSLLGWPLAGWLWQQEPCDAGGKAPCFWKTWSNTQDRRVPRQKKGGQILSWIQPQSLATKLGDFFAFFHILVLVPLNTI